MEDEAVEAVLAMNQKHILPYPKLFVFSASSLPQKISLLPSSLPPTSPLYLPHMILHSLHRQSLGAAPELKSSWSRSRAMTTRLKRAHELHREST